MTCSSHSCCTTQQRPNGSSTTGMHAHALWLPRVGDSQCIVRSGSLRPEGRLLTM